MLTCMNSRLTKITSKDKQNYIFEKSKSYEISRTDTSHKICSIEVSENFIKGVYLVIISELKVDR